MEMSRTRKRDGLYRRENKIFAFRFKTDDGEWREKYTGSTDRAVAVSFKTNFLEQLKKGTLPTEMAAWRLDQAEKWWIEFRRPRIAESTLNSERYRMHHFGRLLSNKHLSEISNADLDRYAGKRLEEGVGAWSINKEILLWSLVLKKAKLWSRLREDYKPLRTKGSDIGRSLTHDELRQLADVAESSVDWEAAFYGSVLAVNSGLRGGEIKKLRIGAIDLVRRRLVIRRADAKTEASARYIELNRDATAAAERLLLRASLLGVTSPVHFLMPKHLSRISHGVCKGQRGYDPDQPQKYWDTAWTSLTKAAGLEGFRFHDLRHTFISHMVELGVPLGVIQAMVGHISSRMLRHYTHIASGVARKAVELLDTQCVLARRGPQDEPPVVRMDRIN
jgi:integrase